MNTQSQHFMMRPPILQDLEAVTNLINRCSLADIGIANETVYQLRSFWVGQAEDSPSYMPSLTNSTAEAKPVSPLASMGSTKQAPTKSTKKQA